MTEYQAPKYSLGSADVVEQTKPKTFLVIFMEMGEFLHADVTGLKTQENQDRSQSNNSELPSEIK